MAQWVKALQVVGLNPWYVHRVRRELVMTIVLWPLHTRHSEHTHTLLSFLQLGNLHGSFTQTQGSTSPQSRLRVGVLGVRVLPNCFQQDLAASLSAVFRKHLSQPYSSGGRMIKWVISQLEISELKLSFTRNVS